MDKLTLWLGVILIGCSCSNDKMCSPIEREIISRCVQKDSTYQLKLGELTKFDWDTLYIINGPAFPEEVKEFTGFNYNNVIQDDNMLYLFATKNGIIEEYVSSCKYRMILKGVNNGFTKYTSSNIVKIRNRIDEGIQHYKLVSVE